MKVKIVTTFCDKNTGETMQAGKITEYGDDRARELIYLGFVQEVKEPKKKAEPKK